MAAMDATDRKILVHLQDNAAQPVAEIARKVGLSVTPCWRRIQRLEEIGVIRKRVALLDPNKVGVGMSVFVALRTDQHNAEWLDSFATMIAEMPEVVEFYRMSGEVDYLLRVVVADMAAYDAFYRRLIGRVQLTDVSSSFAMEEIKFTTSLPIAQDGEGLGPRRENVGKRPPGVDAAAVDLVPQGIEQKPPGKQAAAAVRRLDHRLCRRARHQGRDTRLRRHQRCQRTRFRRDPVPDGNGETALAGERAGMPASVRQASFSRHACRRGPAAWRWREDGIRRRHHPVDKGRAAFKPVPHQAAVELDQQIVRKPVLDIVALQRRQRAGTIEQTAGKSRHARGGDAVASGRSRSTAPENSPARRAAPGRVGKRAPAGRSPAR